MYIEPNTTISVLHNVPLDTTFDHTIYFDTAQNQHIYFFTKIKYTYSKQTYQRVRRGYIRVQQNANDLYDCNYVMFQNTSYGNKWFYAFIESVEYINDSVAEISFKIDPMQTWMFDYTLQQCHVLREHSATDRIGDNLVPEDVNTGEYVTGFPVTTGVFTNWKIVVVATGDIDSTLLPIPTDGGYYAGVYGSCAYHVFTADANGVASIKTLLRNLSLFNNQSMIAGIYMCPAALIPADISQLTTAVASKNDAYLRIPNFTVPFNAKGETSTSGVEFIPFGGYVPKNNKLYTYPYNYFICTNQQGEVKEFKYEYFDATLGEVFHMVCDYGLEPTVMIAPIGYMQKRQTGTTMEENLQHSVSISNFPKCTWATTDLGAKLVQSGIALALLSATQGASASLFKQGGMSVNAPMPPLDVEPAGYLPPSNKLATRSWSANHLPISGTPNERYDYGFKLTPTESIVAGGIARGVLNSHVTANIGRGNTMYIVDGFDFIFKQVFLDAPFARIVDEYFNCYGYATNVVKVPNINARPHWSYVKTANCTITGSIPCDDAKQICEIYNNGITFWKNGDEVGNYFLDNRPIIR